ncbi:MAG: hypothetical protein WCQ32_02150 [bacterium]
MIIEFQNTKNDYKEFRKNLIQVSFKKFLKNRQKLILSPLFILFFYIVSIIGGHFNPYKFILGVIIIIIIIFSPLSIFFIKSALIRNKEKKRKEKGFYDRKKITTTEDGLLIESDTINEVLKWKDIEMIPSDNNFRFILITCNKKMILIPKKVFLLESDVENFLTIIKEGITKTK